MKICMTAREDHWDAALDPRFGRCAYFLIIETETQETTVINNNGGASGGSGVQAGQIMVDQDVQVVLTGNVGPNAFQTLETAGIRVYAGLTGTVRDVLEKFKNNDLPQPMKKASVESHFGEMQPESS